MSRNSRAVLALLAGVSVAACSDGVPAYGGYRAVDSGGWQRGDTVGIVLGPLRHGGQYACELGLRTTSLFPFTQLSVTVSQESRPSGFARRDTLTVRIADDGGKMLGEGVSHYQYLVPLPSTVLAKGDTLSVAVCHNMLRSPLAGVTDVGFTIKKK